MNRRGTSLLELVIAVALTSVVSVLVWSILTASMFRLRERSERISMTHALRVSAAAARSALEGLGLDSIAAADLVSIAPDGFVARQVRGSGTLCDAAAGVLTARDGPSWWLSTRAPVLGRDSVLLGTIAGPDGWIRASLTGAPISGLCPDGTDALRLPVALSATELASVGAGSPIRFFESQEMRGYSSSGAEWVGVRSLGSGGTIQPLAGPFALSGVSFTYRDAAGFAVSAASATRLVRGWLDGITEHAGGFGMARVPLVAADSAWYAVLLRNAP